MWLIVRKSIQFFKEKIEEHPISKEKMVVIEDSYTVYPAQDPTVPQEVPDWIKEDEQFKIAQKDHAIVVCEAPVQKEEEDKPKKEFKNPVGLQSHSTAWKK